MIPRADLADAQKTLKRTTFDALFEGQIKGVPVDKGKPLKLGLEVYIESISKVSAVDEDFRVSMFLVQKWNVSKTNCVNFYKAMAYRGVKISTYFERVQDFQKEMFFGKTNEEIISRTWEESQAVLEKEHFAIFWMPDIFLSNAKNIFSQVSSLDTQFLEVGIQNLSSNTTQYDVKSDAVCTFRWVQRFGADIACKMHFRFYPIDVQTCPIFFTSVSYTANDLDIEMFSVTASESIQLGDQTYDIAFEDTDLIIMGSKKSAGKVTLTFTRVIISLLVGQMIPATLTVALVLSSLWLKLDALNDRINAGMVCLFTLLTQFSAVRGQLPAISYITFLDYYMILCIVFVIIQLLESIAVTIIWRREKNKRQKQEQEEALGKVKKRNMEQTEEETNVRYQSESWKRTMEADPYFARNYLPYYIRTEDHDDRKATGISKNRTRTSGSSFNRQGTSSSCQSRDTKILSIIGGRVLRSLVFWRNIHDVDDGKCPDNFTKFISRVVCYK